MSGTLITHEPARHRYSLTADGALAGLATYREQPGAIVVLHTEIDPALGGRGLGSELVAHILEDARARDLSVLPRCPFVSDYMRRHPEYTDLVPAEHRARFGL